jgi:hypothetical protein
MAGVLQHLRSSTLDKRPNPASMVDGQVAINYASGAPGMFFKDSNGDLVKVGPVHVGSSAPNVSPASGGTAGNSIGEQWLDNSGGTYVFKIWDGSAWRSEAGEFVNTTGDTMTGALGVIAGSASAPGLFFSGDANSGLYSPGADQVAVATNGLGRLFVDASGRVGVGSSGTPTYRFHVRDSNDGGEITVACVENNGSLASTESRLLFVQGGNTTRGAYVGGLNESDAGQPTSFVVGTSAAYAGPTERLRITSAGLVGIGTSSPGVKIDIVSDNNTSLASVLRVNSNNVAVNTSLAYDGLIGSGELFVRTSSASKLYLGTNNTNALTIDTSGNVGIGTTSPGSELHVAASSGFAELRLAGASGSGAALEFYNSTTNLGDIFIDASNNMIFRNASEAFRVDSSRRLLVGTSTQQGDHYLQVQGSATASSYPGSIFLRRGLANASIGDGNQLGVIDFGNQDGGKGATISAEGDAAWGTNDYPGRLVFSTTADGDSSPTERLRITSAGFVGIGSSSPVSTLDAAGDISITGNENYLYLYSTALVGSNARARIRAVGSGGGSGYGGDFRVSTRKQDNNWNTDAFVVDSSGNVGIGTTSPGSAFEVKPSASLATLGIQAGTINTDSIRIQAGGTANTYLEYRGYLGHAWFVDATERARIDSSGRLLVGTSSTFDQSARLQIIADTGTSVAANFYSYGADNSQFVIGAARGTVASPTTLNSNDTIGGVYFRGHDGTSFKTGAQIQAQIDGITPSSDLPSRLVFSTTADGASSPTERMRITNGGDFYFNCTVTTKTTEGFRVENSGQPTVSRGTNGTFIQFFHAGDGSQIGSITNNGGTATAYNTSSDYRLKENVTAVTDGITRLQQLKPSRFNFIADPDKTVDGFLAHEVQTIVPEAITGEKDAVDDDGNPVYQGIDQSKLVPLLTAALQEAIGEIESLKARVAALETP